MSFLRWVEEVPTLKVMEVFPQLEFIGSVVYAWILDFDVGYVELVGADSLPQVLIDAIGVHKTEIEGA